MQNSQFGSLQLTIAQTLNGGPFGSKLTLTGQVFTQLEAYKYQPSLQEVQSSGPVTQVLQAELQGWQVLSASLP